MYIELFGKAFEIWQALLMVYIFGYGIVLGLRNTFFRFLSLFGGNFSQTSAGQLLDAAWYGSIFILTGSLV
jgi:hypothetical protein